MINSDYLAGRITRGPGNIGNHRNSKEPVGTKVTQGTTGNKGNPQNQRETEELQGAT